MGDQVYNADYSRPQFNQSQSDFTSKSKIGDTVGTLRRGTPFLSEQPRTERRPYGTVTTMGGVSMPYDGPAAPSVTSWRSINIDSATTNLWAN